VPPVGDPARAVYERFLDANPDVRFAPAGGISLEGAADGAAFFMAMAGGTAPDVFYAPLEQIQTYYEQDFLLPIETIAPANDPVLQSILDVVKPVVVQGGHVVAVPIFYQVHAMLYRKDLFRQAGLRMRGPRDWDELFEFALTLHDPEAGVTGYAVYGEEWLFSHFLWQAGGEYLTYGYIDPTSRRFIPLPDADAARPANTKLTIRSTFHHKPGQMAVNLYRRLLQCQWAKDSQGHKMIFRDIDLETGRFITQQDVRSDQTGTTYRVSADRESVTNGVHTSRLYTGVAESFSHAQRPDMTEKFLRGRLGMYVSVPASGGVFWSQLNPAVTGLSQMPIGPSGQRVTIINAGCWCVNSQVQPHKRDAVWRFIRFMTGPEATRINVRNMVHQGLAAFVLPEKLRMAGFAQYVDDVPVEWVRANRDLEKIARPVPHAPGFRMAGPVIGEAIWRLLDHPEKDVAAELRHTADLTDEIFAGAMDETKSATLEQSSKIMLIAAVVFGGFIIVCSIVWLSRQYLQKDPASAGLTPSRRRRGWRTHMPAWLFMLPAILPIVVFAYVPLVRGSFVAFLDYKILGDSVFVGFDNFIGALVSPHFYHSLLITGQFTLLTLAIGFVAPIIVALLLDEVPLGKYLFRTVFYLPAVTSALVIMLLWKQFYDPAPAGMLNKLMATIGLGPFAYLKDSRLALICVIIPAAWASAGPGSLLYLAALKTVPNELHEAAGIDGAGMFRRLRHVTIPALAPLILINLVGAFIGAMQGAGNILVMTGGGPDRATHVISLEIFFNAYVYMKFGYATALAWILGAMLVGFTVLQMKILRRVEFRAAEGP